MLLFFLFLSGALAQEALPIDILVDILLADEKYPIFLEYSTWSRDTVF